MITDAGIFVNDSDPASISDFVNSVHSAGFQRAIVFSNNPLEIENTIPGFYISENTIKGMTNAVRKAPKKVLLAVNAGENNFNRVAITTNGIKLIGGLDSLPKGGFDHITAKMAADRNVGLIIEIEKIINPKTRRHALSQYANILKLQRKYQFPLVIASSAHSKLELRNIYEVIALCHLFGMEHKEVYLALEAMDGILRTRTSVEVIE